MDLFDKKTYDDFYVAYLDSHGRMIYPTDLNDVKVIKEMLKRISSGSLIYMEDKNMYYKARIKRKELDGVKVQIIELSNVTEFFNQVNNASIDEITHLNNRKMARNLFMQYIERAYRKKENFTIILADLDDFKIINDTYGHINGDNVLGEVSRILFCSTRQEHNREQDIVARIGGDEFIIIMKNIPAKIAEQRAEKIRSDVENHQIILFSENNIIEQTTTGTLSIGLYYITYEELLDFYNKGYTTNEIRAIIIDRCDNALYYSKNNGKNMVTKYTNEKTLILKK